MDALQNALAAVDAKLDGSTDEKLLRIHAKVRGLLAGYDYHWSGTEYKPIAVEQFYESPLQNPETNRASRTWRIAGKLDLIAEYHGRKVLFDHKTTSQDISKPDAPYWQQLVVEGQASHYMLLLWMNGIRVDDVVWDVVRKPSILPKSLTKAVRASVVANGVYCGRPVDDATRQQLAGDLDRETLEMYEARLAHDCSIERPEWYFQHRPITRMDAEVLDYANELWQHGQNVLNTKNQDGLPVRNSGACMLYGSACKFLGICSGHDTPESDRWQRKQCVHSELPLDGDGRDILTNSRIRTYQTCQRKHYYDYDLGIERQTDDEREALVFGDFYHAGVNAWWSTFLEENSNGNSNESRSGTESVGIAASQTGLPF